MAAESQDQTAVQAAADQALHTLVAVAVELAAVVVIMMVTHHQEAIMLRGRRLLRAVRGNRAPGDAGMQVAEFAAQVADWDRAERAR